MLPRLLCDRLCSLNPNEDRLAYSVLWILDQNGEVRRFVSCPSCVYGLKFYY